MTTSFTLICVCETEQKLFVCLFVGGGGGVCLVVCLFVCLLSHSTG